MATEGQQGRIIVLQAIHSFTLTAQGGQRWAAGPGKGGIAPSYQLGAVASCRVFHVRPLRWKREAGVREAGRRSALKMGEWATR